MYVNSVSSSNGLNYYESVKNRAKAEKSALNLLNKPHKQKNRELVDEKNERDIEKNEDEKYRVLRSVATLCNFFYSCCPLYIEFVNGLYIGLIFFPPRLLYSTLLF